MTKSEKKKYIIKWVSINFKIIHSKSLFEKKAIAIYMRYVAHDAFYDRF